MKHSPTLYSMTVSSSVVHKVLSAFRFGISLAFPFRHQVEWISIGGGVHRTSQVQSAEGVKEAVILVPLRVNAWLQGRDLADFKGEINVACPARPTEESGQKIEISTEACI